MSGLIHTLSAKFAQDDVKIVKDFDSLPTDDPQFLDDLIEARGWALSVLFVDANDIFPENITEMTSKVN